MDSHSSMHSTGRDTYMVIVILLLVGVPAFVFFNIITFGLFVLLFLSACGLALLVGVNYLLWGRTFSQETAWEREEEELRREIEGAD